MKFSSAYESYQHRIKEKSNTSTGCDGFKPAATATATGNGFEDIFRQMERQQQQQIELSQPYYL
jgi:hypothetical protein